MDKAKREHRQLEYLATARRLVQRYLEETGLSAEAARKGLVYTRGEWANYHRFTHLPEEEEEYRTALIVTPGAPPVPDLLTWVQPHVAELESREVDLGDGFSRTEAPDRYELAIALTVLAGEEAQQRAEDAEHRAAEAERRLAHRPGLRIGARAVKAYTIRQGDYVTALRALRSSRRITKEARRLLERRELLALRGDELLVAAGLLEIARQNGALRPFGPARARMGGVVFDARLVVDRPRIEEFGRLIGFLPGPDGRIAREARRRIEAAEISLSGAARPIVVESVEMRGKKRISTWEIVEDVPIRKSTQADGHEVLELHGSLALGYWWGHILISPRRWEEARQAIGARYTDDAMKWADVYFRRLVLGVQSEHQRKGTPPAQLASGLPKRLLISTLLEELELEDYRKKRGSAMTAERLEKVLDFCVAAGSLVAWKRDGAAAYAVTLPHPVEVKPPEDAALAQLRLLPESAGVMGEAAGNGASRGK